MNIIDHLHPTSSCGKDGLSTKVLKLIKTEINEAVTLIINHSIPTGIFDDDDAIFFNYRPIYILPAV